MKKTVIVLFLLAAVLALAGCDNHESHAIEIIIPPGSMEQFAYSDVELSPQKNEIRLHAWAGISDTEVVLKPVEVRTEAAYEPTYLTQGMPVTMEAEKGGWFKVGVSIQNPGDKPITVSVKVENVEIRIP